MTKINELKILLNERIGKAQFGTGDGFTYAVKVEELKANDFFTKPLGRRLDDIKVVKAFKERAKSVHIDSKGKKTLPAVRKWIKENKPVEFYAKWKEDSDNYKDDSVQVFYIKGTTEPEGIENEPIG